MSSGTFWLEATRGTDLTEAFETSHVNPSVVNVLRNYYVKNAEHPRNSPYTFKHNGFYNTLKRKVGIVIFHLKKSNFRNLILNLLQISDEENFLVGGIISSITKFYIMLD